MRWFTAWLDRLVAFAAGLVAALISGLFRAPGTAARRATSPFVVRRGTAAEVVDVRHRVLRAGKPRATAIFSGDDAPGARHWVAVQADRVVGVVSVLPADATRQLRGMAVLPELQREGIGAKLLAAVDAEEPGPLWCNAREGVVAFYARHGWTAVGPTFEVAGIGPHRRMTRR